jgi:hypothetical protein
MGKENNMAEHPLIAATAGKGFYTFSLPVYLEQLDPDLEMCKMIDHESTKVRKHERTRSNRF